MKKLTFLIGFTHCSHTLMAQNVGINSPAPQEKLDVNGKIKVGDDTTISSAGAIRFNA
ncbi:MAG: hypothetical protein IPO92_15245 [Saprospiraceae bacterium]|nr:hypothetical protein [Saprospiraceae bacterium]